MSPSALLACIALSLAVYTLIRRLRFSSVAAISGPDSESFLLGNLKTLYQSQAGEADFKWQAAYGDVVRIKGLLGEDRLLISDPKALQYIYQTSGYRWPKLWDRREVSRIVGGYGLAWAEGDVHKRQRKVMLPSFGMPETRSLLPVFAFSADKLSSKWKDMLASSPSGSLTVNIPHWMSRATLDAIGQAAFDYRFGAIDGEDNALAKSYRQLFTSTFGSPSPMAIFTMSTLRYFPGWLRQLLRQNAGKLDIARENTRLVVAVAKSLINAKADALLQGVKSRDVMSILVRSNASEDEKSKLSEDEMISQMRTIMVAGHETTSTTLTWMLFELARHPDMQRRLRAEVWDLDANLRAQGRSQYNAHDLDDMPFATAVIKETLRFHPIIPLAFRQASQDDILPLTTPIKTEGGDIITELHVPKGIKIVASIAGYNRNKLVFGEDAHLFNPDRWLRATDGKKQAAVGVYANLMTFSAGLRSCIGWRFAVLELHAFLIDLIGNFEFELTQEAHHVRREPCIVMLPTIEGQATNEAQLPLIVRVAIREE